MNKKKHIDRLFQDKLQNFEATPSDAVWENINAKLNLEKEKDRKVIPIWWKVAGIAAGLLLLVTLSNSLFFNNETSSVPNNDVVNTEKDINPNSQQKDVNPSNDEIITTNNLTNEDDVVLDDDTNSEGDNLNTSFNKTVVNNTESKSNAVVNTSTNKQNTSRVSASQNASAESYKKGAVSQHLKNRPISTQNREETAVVEHTNQELNDRVKENNLKNTTQIDQDKVKELTNSVKNANSEHAVTETSSKSTNDITKEENSDSTIADTKTEEEKLSVQEELDKANEEKDVIDEEKLNKKRWSVAPNIAPVYFNAFGSGSSIDSKFDNSPKSGEINMSYGVAANYQVSDKLSIRAGVNQVKLGYNTNNVIVYNNVETEVNDRPLKNVALNNESQNLSFLSSEGLNFGQVPDVVANNVSSSIEQRLGFIEVPVEAEYKLTDKKLGLSLIGGFSTLFLSENKVYSTLQNERQLLGEATNINKTSFSANLGVGVKYKVSEKINLNLEPVFKYQLNTFSDTSGSFNPYTIGVYTGLSFKF